MSNLSYLKFAENHLIPYNDYRHMTIVNIEGQMKKEIAAGQFKAHCLQLMDEVRQKHYTLIITKHGKPIAKLMPIDEEPITLFGALKGTLKIKGDIVSSLNESWDAEQ